MYFRFHITKSTMVQKEKKTVQEQVKEALDGRTQRWLSFSIRVPESDLSKKMKGKIEFTQDEIDSINSLLNSQIKLS